MINIPKMKVGIVAVSRDCFPESLSVNRRKALIGYNHNISDKTANEFADEVTKELKNNLKKKYDRYVVLRGHKGVFRNAGINH